MKIILTFLLCSFQGVLAQSIYLSAIAGNYTMGDLKTIQNKLIVDYTNQVGVPVKNELLFPVSIQAEVGGNYRLSKKNLVGIFVNYAITKAQLGYSDYSGELVSIQNISRYALGAKYTLSLSRFLSCYAKGSFVRSALNFDERLILGGITTSTNNVSFHSTGFSLEPGLQFFYELSPFALQLQAGYEFNFQGNTWADANNSLYLLKPSGGPAKIDWTGYRVGLAIEYKF